MINTKMGAFLLAGFIAGAFIASPELRAFAANTVGSADIINNSIQSVDIKDGEVKTDDIAPGAVGSLRIKDNDVKAQDIAPNAVGASEIADGTITYADASRSFVKIEHRNDCNCGGTGWDPDGQSSFERVFDDAVTLSSVISISLVPSFGRTCSTSITFTGSFDIDCDGTILGGTGLNYAIFKK